MPDLDAEMLVDQAVMLSLISREQLREARAEAEDASADTVLRMLLRKGSLTSWQIDRLKKGDPSGFFYGDAKALFHLAEGTFARVYRGEHTTTRLRDCASAARTSALRSPAAASSSRSRKIGTRRRGSLSAPVRWRGRT